MSPESLVARKRELRRTVIECRRALAPGPARVAAQAVATHVGVLSEFIAAECVALYAPRPGAGELDTRPLFELVHRMGKRRLLPRCTDAGRLEYVAVERWESLRPGRYGIPEPGGESVSLPGEGAVVICPGVAFDAFGGRLGMGRGYIDRTFPVRGDDGPFLVGVGYACQVVDDLPRQEHDQRMDAVVTEEGPMKLRSRTAARG